MSLKLKEQENIAKRQLAANVKSSRILAGKTVGELAEFLNLSVPMIRKIENGDSGFYAHKLSKIAEFLDTTVNDLLNNYEISESKPIILRKELILTAEKLSEITDVGIRKNLTNMINKLASK